MLKRISIAVLMSLLLIGTASAYLHGQSQGGPPQDSRPIVFTHFFSASPDPLVFLLGMREVREELKLGGEKGQQVQEISRLSMKSCRNSALNLVRG